MSRSAASSASARVSARFSCAFSKAASCSASFASATFSVCLRSASRASAASSSPRAADRREEGVAPGPAALAGCRDLADALGERPAVVGQPQRGRAEEAEDDEPDAAERVPIGRGHRLSAPPASGAQSLEDLVLAAIGRGGSAALAAQRVLDRRERPRLRHVRRSRGFDLGPSGCAPVGAAPARGRRRSTARAARPAARARPARAAQDRRGRRRRRAPRRSAA